VRIIEGLTEDWRRLDEGIDHLLVGRDRSACTTGCWVRRLVSIPGRPIISIAMVALTPPSNEVEANADAA